MHSVLVTAKASRPQGRTVYNSFGRRRDGTSTSTSSSRTYCPHQQGLRQQCISSTIVLIKVAQNSQLVHLQGHHRQHRPPQRVSGAFSGCGRSKATQQNSQFSVHVHGHHRQQQSSSSATTVPALSMHQSGCHSCVRGMG